MIGAILLFYILIAGLELIPLVKRKKKKEIWTYSGMMLVALAVSLLLGLGINLPSPSDPIKRLVFAVIGK